MRYGAVGGLPVRALLVPARAFVCPPAVRFARPRREIRSTPRRALLVPAVRFARPRRALSFVRAAAEV